jgi:soluble lytic murein transglycosylase-like protein
VFSIGAPGVCPFTKGLMNIAVSTFRTPVQHLRSLALAAVVLALVSMMAAQAVHPVAENGHIVWTNEDTAQPDAVSGTAAATGNHAVSNTRASMQLCYWSNVEQRWIRVRPASPSAMRSAEVVAGEVSSYINSRPKLGASKAPVKGEIAAKNPNYSQAAENRLVSSAQIDRYIKEAAARHHVDPNLVRALVKVESNFNPRAVSRKGAMGLMQLMPATAHMYDVRNPFDAAQNVDAGVRHLKGLLDNFGGNVPLSLAAYNAGQGAVERSAGIPPYTETRNYVKRITHLMGDDAGPHAGASDVIFENPIRASRDDRGRLTMSNIE